MKVTKLRLRPGTKVILNKPFKNGVNPSDPKRGKEHRAYPAGAVGIVEEWDGDIGLGGISAAEAKRRKRSNVMLKMSNPPGRILVPKGEVRKV